MKILFDTNVVLDVLLLREPFFRSATQLLIEVEQHNIEGYICSTTVTTIHYLIEMVNGSQVARIQVENLLKLFNIAVVGKHELESALQSAITDYEDAVLNASALTINADGIVTGNLKAFKKSKLTVYSPDELTALLNITKQK